MTSSAHRGSSIWGKKSHRKPEVPFTNKVLESWFLESVFTLIFLFPISPGAVFGAVTAGSTRGGDWLTADGLPLCRLCLQHRQFCVFDGGLELIKRARLVARSCSRYHTYIISLSLSLSAALCLALSSHSTQASSLIFSFSWGLLLVEACSSDHLLTYSP